MGSKVTPQPNKPWISHITTIYLTNVTCPGVRLIWPNSKEYIMAYTIEYDHKTRSIIFIFPFQSHPTNMSYLRVSFLIAISLGCLHLSHPPILLICNLSNSSVSLVTMCFLTFIWDNWFCNLTINIGYELEKAIYIQRYLESWASELTRPVLWTMNHYVG